MENLSKQKRNYASAEVSTSFLRNFRKFVSIYGDAFFNPRSSFWVSSFHLLPFFFFSFAWWKTSWQRPCILVKKGTFMGPVALWCTLKMWLINWLLKLDLSQQEVLSPPFQVGIISAVQAVYDPPLLLGSGLRLNDWSSALRLASHPIFHLIALSSLRESVKV